MYILRKFFCPLSKFISHKKFDFGRNKRKHLDSAYGTKKENIKHLFLYSQIVHTFCFFNTMRFIKINTYQKFN